MNILTVSDARKRYGAVQMLVLLGCTFFGMARMLARRWELA
jgi:hypothetical protein